MVVKMNKTELKRPLIILRALVVFAVILAVLAGVYWISYHHYKDVAYWSGDVSLRDTLVYDGNEYKYAGKWGEGEFRESSYKFDDIIGEVTPVDKLASFGELVRISSVEKYPDLVIVTYEDGSDHVFYKAGTVNPAAPETSVAETTAEETESPETASPSESTAIPTESETASAENTTAESVTSLATE
jgi:hypothetical protein